MRGAKNWEKIIKRETGRKSVTLSGREVTKYFLEFLHEIPKEEVKTVLPEVWTKSYRPASVAHYTFWADMFNETGFVTDTDDIERPSDGTIKLYRAATSEYTGMSWTSDFYTAIFFHMQNLKDGYIDSKIYEADINSADILAIFNDKGESEYVINPESIIGQRRIVFDYVPDEWNDWKELKELLYDELER